MRLCGRDVVILTPAVRMLREFLGVHRSAALGAAAVYDRWLASTAVVVALGALSRASSRHSACLRGPGAVVGQFPILNQMIQSP